MLQLCSSLSCGSTRQLAPSITQIICWPHCWPPGRIAAAACCAAAATAKALATAARIASVMGGCDDPSDPLAAAFLPGLMVCQSCWPKVTHRAAEHVHHDDERPQAVSRLVLFAAAARLHDGWSSLLWSHTLVFGEPSLRHSALCAYLYKYPPRGCKNRSISRGGRGGGSGAGPSPCGARAFHFG